MPGAASDGGSRRIIMGMSTRRDSRTDEERLADDAREREFHRKREEAGLPPLNHSTITIFARDITQEEIQQLSDHLWAEALAFLGRPEFTEDRDARQAYVSGSSFTVEAPNVEAP